MTVRVEGTAGLEARLRAVQRAPKQMMGRTGLLAVRYQKQLVPRKTGNLGRTIHLGRVTNTSVETVASANYAAAVERGSKPHIIRPRKAKALFFPSQKVTTERFGPGATLNFTRSGRLSSGSVKKFGNAAFVLTKEVRHPGTKPQPYMVPGMEKARDEAGIDAIVTAWNDAA